MGSSLDNEQLKGSGLDNGQQHIKNRGQVLTMDNNILIQKFKTGCRLSRPDPFNCRLSRPGPFNLGFTLIELVITIVIISILSSLAFINWGKLDSTLILKDRKSVV